MGVEWEREGGGGGGERGGGGGGGEGGGGKGGGGGGGWVGGFKGGWGDGIRKGGVGDEGWGGTERGGGWGGGKGGCSLGRGGGGAVVVVLVRVVSCVGLPLYSAHPHRFPLASPPRTPPTRFLHRWGDPEAGSRGVFFGRALADSTNLAKRTWDIGNHVPPVPDGPAGKVCSHSMQRSLTANRPSRGGSPVREPKQVPGIGSVHKSDSPSRIRGRYARCRVPRRLESSRGRPLGERPAARREAPGMSRCHTRLGLTECARGHAVGARIEERVCSRYA
jgi:hypothetical protein